MVTNAVYLVAIILAGALTTAMALNLWINRRIIETDYSILLVIFLWLWITTQIGECLVGPLAAKIVLYKLKFVCISFTSVFLLGFSIGSAGSRKHPAIRYLLMALAAPVLVCAVLSFFPFFETLVWKRFYLSPNNLLLDIEPAIGYTVYNVYNILILVAGYGFLLGGALFAKGSKRLHLLPFLAAGLLASTAALADFLLKQQIFYYRTMPIALSISSLTAIYYLRLRYLRTIPLAQHAVSQAMSDGLIILNPHDEIMYVNPAAVALFHQESVAIVGKPLAVFVGGLAAFVADAETDAAWNRTAVIEKRWYDVSLSPIRGRRGKVVSKLFVLRDVTRLVEVENSLRDLTDELERKVADRTKQLEDSNRALLAEVEERRRAEERLQASLEEKSVLLGELHHRVKNNLQIVSSLLRLQSHYITDPAALELFDISVSRIRSMAMVHEKLYKSADLAHTQFGQYLHELVSSVVFSHSKTASLIAVDLQVAPLELDIDTSILAGLIVNELVLNSIKHAFPETGVARGTVKNEIAVAFRTDGNDYLLEYSDNGSGLPPDFSIEKTDSLGMKIVVTLAKQLKGTIEILPHRGMKVLLRFPTRRD